MGAYSRQKAAQIVDRAEISDHLVSGVESITDIGGGLVRVVYYINRRSTRSGTLEHVLCRDTLVMPLTAIADLIGKAMMVLGRKIVAGETGISVTH